jgi:hypothetical protein
MSIFEAIKQRQHAIWASGDYAVIGIRVQLVGESLAEAADVRADERESVVSGGQRPRTLPSSGGGDLRGLIGFLARAT